MRDYREEYEVVFVWNRSTEKMTDIVPQNLIVTNLTTVATMQIDLIVEVAHPSIVADYGTMFIKMSDLMV